MIEIFNLVGGTLACAFGIIMFVTVTAIAAYELADSIEVWKYKRQAPASKNSIDPNR